MSKQQTYIRFSLAQRIEHFVLILSFTTLVVTGIPQKYAGSAISQWVIATLGGIEQTRTIHHTAAVVFVLQAIYHAVVVAYKLFVLRHELSMLPSKIDLVTFIGAARYNLGLSKKRPDMPRYSFDEKVEYWAMIWGTIIMAVTGFMLWNPILTTNILPGQIIPAAKAAHGAEAVLAALAILIWHVYHVHLKFFNKSMFTGKMTRHEMAEEHGLELARIESGEAGRQPPQPVIEKRRRVFMPIGIGASLLLLVGLFWFVTAETTAITTVPTPAVPAFSPAAATATPPGLSVETAQIGSSIPHAIEGREQCDLCHGLQGVSPYPEDHVGRPNESCQVCHQPGDVATPAADATGEAAPPSGVGATIPHPIEGREQCDACHALTGMLPMPADHEGRSNDTCTVCHQPAEPEGAAAEETPAVEEGATAEATPATEEGATAEETPVSEETPAEPDATGTPEPQTGEQASETPVRFSQPIPHSIEGAMYEDCTTCHGLGGIRPYPPSHETFTSDMCTRCHEPQS